MWTKVICATAVLCIGALAASEEHAPSAKELPVTAVAPYYPELALAANVSGEVRVDLIVREDGTVAAVTTESGPYPLKSAAESAAMQWRFEHGSANRKIEAVFCFTILAGPDGSKRAGITFHPPSRFEVLEIARVPPDRIPQAAEVDQRK